MDDLITFFQISFIRSFICVSFCSGLLFRRHFILLLFDFKSINGPLFIAKQNVLSLTNVNTAVGYESFTEEEDQSGGSAVGNFIRNNLALNQGIYTPASTIASTVGNPFGIHPNKQGLNPFNPNLNSTVTVPLFKQSLIESKLL